ncbi:MAG: BON domain-containing protein [Candidatus Azobacteroides sp.]|nr:BON domain-containing protein [Candidatus Azobacteroides sp.]
MKKNLLFCVWVLLTGAFFTACTPSDESLQQQASNALSTLPEVSVKVSNGTATLSGTVETEELKANAEDLVEAINGIKSIENNIGIKVPEVLTPDEELAKKITDALSAEKKKFKDVKVEVTDLEVTLTGIVNRSDMDRLMEIVNEYQPKKVDNLLNIRKS